MLLSNVHIIGKEGIHHIQIDDGRISSISKELPATNDTLIIDCNGYICFPGLVNSHDHLDFDLFPSLGNRIYPSYIEWGADIQINNRKEIDEVLKISGDLRAAWGIYKNLIAGVTTVVNHGKKLHLNSSPITIFQEADSIHSINNEKRWKFRLNKLVNRRAPVVIHIGEGTDENARKEIDRLIRWNLFKRKIIAVHAVAMNRKQARSFEALVWCPASNQFLLGRTAAMDVLKKETSILFGTDSTLTSSWNIWEHLRMARMTGLLNDSELFDAVTSKASQVWNLKEKNSIETGLPVNLVLAKSGDNSPGWDSFYGVEPSGLMLVLKGNSVLLLDKDLESKFHGQLDKQQYSKFSIDGQIKYVVGDLAELVRKIKSIQPNVELPVQLF